MRCEHDGATLDRQNWCPVCGRSYDADGLENTPGTPTINEIRQAQKRTMPRQWAEIVQRNKGTVQ